MNEKWQVSFCYGPGSMFSKNTHWIDCRNKAEAQSVYHTLCGSGEVRITTNRGYNILFQCSKIENLEIEHFAIKPKKENNSSWGSW